MSRPFDIPQAVDDLYDVLALANILKATCDPSGDAWRLLDMLGERLQATINRLDHLDIMTTAAEPIPPALIDEIYTVVALTNATKAMHESGDDAWRVLNVQVDQLLSVIERLWQLNRAQEAA